MLKMFHREINPKIKEYLKNKNVEKIFYDIYPDFDYYFKIWASIKNDSETECSHIFPVNYFSKWLSEEQQKEINKNKKIKRSKN